MQGSIAIWVADDHCSIDRLVESSWIVRARRSASDANAITASQHSPGHSRASRSGLICYLLIQCPRDCVLAVSSRRAIRGRRARRDRPRDRAFRGRFSLPSITLILQFAGERTAMWTNAAIARGLPAGLLIQPRC